MMTSCLLRADLAPFAGLHALAQINVPPPAPPGMPQPTDDPGIHMPTPEETPPEIDEPVVDPAMPIREPGVIRPPQAASWLH